MDSVEPLAKDNSRQLEAKIQQTQASLERNLAGLRHSIDVTIDDAKDSMDDAYTAIKRSVDLAYQTKRHPKLAVAISALLGAMTARLLLKPGRTASADHQSFQTPQSGPSTIGKIQSSLQDELGSLVHGDLTLLGRIAIGSAYFWARKTLIRSVRSHFGSESKGEPTDRG